MAKPADRRSNRSPVRMILFVAGGEPNSRRAEENLRRLCEDELKGNYELQRVDVLEDFQAAVERHIMVTPALVVTDPPPAITVLGDLRDTDRLRAALRRE